MLQDSYQFYEDAIQKYKLVRSAQRDQKLLSATCFVHVYMTELKDYLGFNYSAYALCGSKEGWESLTDNDFVVEKMQHYIDKNKPELLSYTANLMRQDGLMQNRIKNLLIEDIDVTEKLAQFLDLYVKFYGNFTIYNTFNKYEAHHPDKKGLDIPLFQEIARLKSRAITFYPVIDDELEFLCYKIGKEHGFEGELLMLATMPELKAMLALREFTPEHLRELKERSHGYFYLNIHGDEFITTKKDVIQKLYKKHLTVDGNSITELSGNTAYPGKVQGTVYMSKGKLKTADEIPENAILVAPMTNPGQLLFINKFKAVITDEGGITSHAAIIAREQKIPCIVGTRIGTKIFQNGDKIEVDATKGLVKKL